MDRLAAMDAFIRVVDSGSFSGAAKQLRMGQPAVSKTIVQLEERLSARLLAWVRRFRPPWRRHPPSFITHVARDRTASRVASVSFRLFSGQVRAAGQKCVLAFVERYAAGGV